MIHPEDQVFATPRTEWWSGNEGLSTRAYFAALAMQGLLSQHTSVEYVDGKHDVEPAYKFAEIPALALRQADMLIAELNKKQSTER